MTTFGEVHIVFVRIEYKDFNGTTEGYVSEGFDDAEDVRQQGDLVVITRTVDEKTVEVMVPASRVIRIETEHDEDVVAKAKAELAAYREAYEENSRLANSGLMIPTAV